jgi:hypothetical protein
MPLLKLAIFNQFLREFIIIALAISAYSLAENGFQITMLSIIVMAYTGLSSVCHHMWASNIVGTAGRDKQIIYFAKLFKRTSYIAQGMEDEVPRIENVQEHVQKKLDIACHANFILVVIVLYNLIRTIFFA